MAGGLVVDCSADPVAARGSSPPESEQPTATANATEAAIARTTRADPDMPTMLAAAWAPETAAQPVPPRQGGLRGSS